MDFDDVTAPARPPLDRPPAPRFAVLDVETTGLCANTNSIVEIAILELHMDGSIVHEWSSLVSSPGDGDVGASEIHGITRSMLKDAPCFEALIEELVDRLCGRIIVGHFVAFDLDHLMSECARIRYPLPNLRASSLCTRELAQRYLLPRSRTLQSCCDAVGVTMFDAHTARGDTRATAQLFRHFVDQIDWATLARLANNAQSLAWPLRFRTTASTRRSMRSAAPASAPWVSAEELVGPQYE